jgi:GR25 family glycosyltransferase involved in LPS biosynthesis
MNNSSFSEKYKIKLVIITLFEYPQRLEKLREITKILSDNGLIIEYFYGVNGKDIEITDTNCEFVKKLEHNFNTYYYDNRVRLNKEPMSRGVIGACWSHLEVYKKLLNDKFYDNYIIFEDDFELLTSIQYLMDALMNLPTDYDICHIAFSDWYPFIRLNKINDYFYDIHRQFFNRATAYIISKSGARKLLTFSNGQINIPPDDLLSNSYLFGKERCNIDIKFYVSEHYIFKEIDNTISSVFSIDKII